jgi:hypothetical protein
VEIAQRIVPADVRYRCFVVENEIIMLDSIRCKLLWLASLLAVIALAGGPVRAAEPGTATIRITTPMPPPDWALLERELLRAQERACAEFFDRYFDDRGYLECVERWGGDDGPDDAIENVNDWPVLYALGGADPILTRFKKAWEGHLRQYTNARTTEVPFARDGMFYKEFHVMFDWFHLGEGLSVFNLEGLCDPWDTRYRQRVARYAGFYLGDDPGAANYDPEVKIIRSLFNGSRGPLLRKATALDWAGDPIEVAGRFRLGHGEHSYAQMLEHFQDYSDIVGDHPLNLGATNLALNAYMLTHEERYKRWVLDYVGAWRQRMLDNGGIIPTNIGLDGRIGGACDGKWYGGVYGWGFSVIDPVTLGRVNRNYHPVAINGFGNAFLLTGDNRFLDAWRKQIDAVNSHAKVEGGRALYPHMHGDQGWYDYRPEPYRAGALELFYWSMKEPDRRRVPDGDWLAFLEGRNPAYPATALRGDFAVIRRKVDAMRRDSTTPDTRLADDPMAYNPATVASLVRLMLGGLPPKHQGELLQARVRYFDPMRRRPGLPEDVAALVDSLKDDSTSMVLVNLNQAEARTVVVQAGAYGEHLCERVATDERTTAVSHPSFRVDLAPGSGGRLTVSMKRYAVQPTLAPPWDRDN